GMAAVGAYYGGYNAMGIDAEGNSYIAGSFADTIDLDPGSGVANRYTQGHGGGFIAKYDTSGSYIWGFSIGGLVGALHPDQIVDLAIDAVGNVYVLGLLESDSANFDPNGDVVLRRPSSKSGDGAL